MKAQDLRIGNWVKSSSNREYRISLSWFECCKDSSEGRDIQLDTNPIELTEEWLIKFGYKVKNGLLSSEFYDKNFSITVDTKGKFDFWISECDDCAVIKEIKYVHQLQNLYFSLTGEELTINE